MAGGEGGGLPAAVGRRKPGQASAERRDRGVAADVRRAQHRRARGLHGESGAESILGLRDWLVEHAHEWEAEDYSGGYRLGAVDEADLGSIAHGENTIWAEVLGAGVPLRVRGEVAGYAEAAVEADQTFADPATYIRWDRTITGGTADGFIGGGEMETANEIEKSGPFGIVIPYSASKDFRWVDGVQAAMTWVSHGAPAAHRRREVRVSSSTVTLLRPR